MARPPRFAPASLPQHVTQRGNYRQNVFLTDADRRFYLALLDRHSAERRVKVIAYCLMTNHVHLILEPETDDALSILMQCLQCEYARSMNLRHDLQGHLWQARFNACVMDEFHLGLALAYVELNPVRAGITQTAVDYAWSSAGAHTGQSSPLAWLDMEYFEARFTKQDWNFILERQHEDRAGLAAIRRATRLNEPFAAPGFVKTLEDAHHRRLLRRPPGRPTKPAVQAAG